MASATYRPKRANEELPEGAAVIGNPTPKLDRIDLESAVNDAARCASIARALMEDGLTPSAIHPQSEGYKIVMLSQEQFDDLHFIVGEAAYRARKVCEVFYGRAS